MSVDITYSPWFAAIDPRDGTVSLGHPPANWDGRERYGRRDRYFVAYMWARDALDALETARKLQVKWAEADDDGS